MDLLTDVLNTAGLKTNLLHRRILYEPWAVQFPCPVSIGFHVVTQGEAYLWRANAKTPDKLERGDIAFMARGTYHHISTHPDKAMLKDAPAVFDARYLQEEQPGRSGLLTLVSGAYQLWHEPLHPIFMELPEWYIIRAHEIDMADSLYGCMQVLAGELRKPDLGSKAIVSSLLDVMFHLIFRRVLTLQERGEAWGKAARDPIIGNALALMHQRHADNWTVERLAREVGISRSGFAARFKKALGSAPLQYLMTIRMLKAMKMLSDTQETIESIAYSIGYKDAFSFSKTFKKTVGLSPKHFRQKDQAEKELTWRFS